MCLYRKLITHFLDAALKNIPSLILFFIMRTVHVKYVNYIKDVQANNLPNGTQCMAKL